MERAVPLIEQSGATVTASTQQNKRTFRVLSLAQWLQTLSPEFGSFRVFQYLTLRAVMAALTSLLIGLIAGPFVIRRLVSLKMVSRSVNMRCKRT
jgi:hypothetical protein